MKSVLMSIQPKWCELIASGKKTVEVRKTRPKLETPFNVYIYCTQTKTMGDFILCKSVENVKLFGFNTAKGVNKGFAEKEDIQLKGKVIGEFVCDCIANYEAELWDDEAFERIQEFFEPDDFAEYGEYEYKTIADNGDDFWKENMLCQASCLTIEELRKYVGCGIATFYGWQISDLVIYEKPKELSEFRSYNVRTYLENGYPMPTHEIKRPPQSWCYVEKGGASDE